jgi:two-component system, sensor histidine kinase and response regulator
MLAFASAAHEFKNPLNAIVSSLDLLEPLFDQTKERKFFTIAKSCSNLMLFLIKDILDFSQLEAKSLILNIQPTNIFRLISDCLSALRFKAIEKGIKLEVEEDLFLEKALIKGLHTDENRVK